MQIYIYLCHNLEDCYLKYRLHIHLLNIVMWKVQKSEKNCQHLMCSVDKIIDGHSSCCYFCTCERFLSTRVYTFVLRQLIKHDGNQNTMVEHSTVALSNGVYISVFVVSNTNCNACICCSP